MSPRHEVALDLRLVISGTYIPGRPADVWSIPSTPAVPSKLKDVKCHEVILEGASVKDLWSEDFLDALLADPAIRVKIKSALQFGEPLP